MRWVYAVWAVQSREMVCAITWQGEPWAARGIMARRVSHLEANVAALLPVLDGDPLDQLDQM